MRKSPLAHASPLIALCIALAATLAVLFLAKAPPLTTLAVLFGGGLDSPEAWMKTLSAFIPLFLCATALLATYAAGLWNIGVEGQITMGAVFAAGVLRLPDPASCPPALALALALGAAFCGGTLWALLAGALRVYGRVHELFSGLGLNFAATGVGLWLILGPWKRAGMASLSGTEPLPEAFRLPGFAGKPASMFGVVLAVIAFVLVVWLLRRTTWGLKLAAVRQNLKAARLIGLSPRRRMLEAMALCGGLAGLAGGLLVTGLYHRLIPSISGNFGYTAILAVLMVSLVPWAVPLSCFFFAVLLAGAVQLPMALELDSSLSGVIQGVLVLAFLAAGRLSLGSKSTGNQS
ncbi:ABC transporter permease [Desulfolutivibrio sulfoxidireducens]|uniref:ABC transporter permease n=1 Tax=Desulfolutivibrio sulfoxidireducens TaxID=2773299 RepID=UPI00159DC4AC|nr:ABC transporter permease [Desulfolutivibrio sulfoxidireducens]QLA17664.1 ABC transporter permease [Desulfolutivibrio sulfoxidireducens]